MSEENLDTLSLYFAEIRKFPLLTAEEEVELAKAMKAGGEEAEMARAKLVECNQRLVVSIAKQYQNHGLPLEDLISCGNEGLMKAVDKFDYHLGNRFSTLASWWIRQSITRAVNNTGRTIRIPVHVGTWINDMNRASLRLEQKHGREPTSEEVAKELNIGVARVKMLLRIVQRTISLDQPRGDDEDSASLGDLIADDSASDPSDFVSQESLREQIQQVLSSLNDRERQVLELRFGLLDGVSLTLDAVGEIFGITRERVRQVEVQALRKLRHPIRARRLRDFRDDHLLFNEESETKQYQDPAWLNQKYHVEKLNTSKMAELAGVDRVTIGNWMKLFGIPMRTQSEARSLSHQVRNNGRRYRDKMWLEQKYVEEGMSIYEMAEKESVDPTTILNWMKRHGISRRSLSEAQQLAREMREED